MIHGVSASTLYLEKLPNTPDTLFEFLCQKFTHISSTQWQKRFSTKQILSNLGEPLTTKTPYQYGTYIYYYRFIENETVIPFEHTVIFENDELMVVDKPHFLPVTPAGHYVQHTLLTRLKANTKNANLSPIHRLDKDTAGLILFSKNPDTRHVYQALFEHQRIDKTYHAIAKINPSLKLPKTVRLHLERSNPFYVMQVNTKKPANSQTHIQCLETKGEWAKYQLNPTTGKLHQLRVHLNHLGIAIKNDPYYPTIHHKAADDFSTPLQLLAKSLEFYDPLTHQTLTFHSPQSLTL